MASHAHSVKMQPTVTEVPWSVCVLDITMSCAKTAELTRMTFGAWTRVGSENHVLGGGLDLLRGSSNLWGAPVMQPFNKIL